MSKVRRVESPRVEGSEGRRVEGVKDRRSKCRRVEGSKGRRVEGRRVEGSKGPRVEGSKGGRSRRIKRKKKYSYDVRFPDGLAKVYNLLSGFGLGFRCLGFRVSGFGFDLKVSVFRVSGFGVWGFGVLVWP